MGGNCERKTLAQSFNRSSFVTHIVGKYRLPQALQYQRCSTSSGLSCSMPNVAAGHVCALVVGKALHAHVVDAQRLPSFVQPHVRAVRGMKEDGLVFTFTLQCALFVRLVFKVLFQSVPSLSMAEDQRQR